MNRIYKSVFNKRSGLWQVASELTANVGKTGSTLLKPSSAVVVAVGILGTPNSAIAQTIHQPLSDYFSRDGGAALAGGTGGGKGGLGGGGGGGSVDGVGGAGGNAWGGLGGPTNASGHDAAQANSANDQAQMLFVGLSGGGGGSATSSDTGNSGTSFLTMATNGVLNGTNARDTIVLGGSGGGAGAGAAGNRGGNGGDGESGSLIFQNGITSLTVNQLFIGGDGGSAASYLSGKAGDGGKGTLFLSTHTLQAGSITVGGAAGAGDSTSAGTGGTGRINMSEGSSITTTGGILLRENGSINISNSQGVALLNTDLSGAGSISHIGSGTTILTGTDSRTGSTTVSGGTFQIGDGGTEGSISGNVVTDGSGSLAFNRSNALTYAGAISGSGQLRQIGSGTTTLTGTNVHTGGTNIEAGVLQVGNGGTSGQLGTGSVINNAILTFNRSDSFTVANTLSGTGSLNKLGAGTLTLSGNNTYGGGTTIADGTLQVTNGNSVGSGRVNLQGGNLRANETLTLANSIVATSTGSVSAAAHKTLTLTGNLSIDQGVNLSFGTTTDTGTISLDISNLIVAYPTGDLTVAGGTLTGRSDLSHLTRSLASTWVKGGATLDFASYQSTIKNLRGEGTVKNDDRTTTVSEGFFSGVFTGTGNLQKNTSGTLTLTGANNYTGTTTIQQGVLAVGDGGTSGQLGTGNIINDAILTYNRSDDFTLANHLSGTGSLNKLGTGTLTYTGAGSDYRGNINVDAGTLAVNGTLSGAIQVNNGGILGGSGTTGDVRVNSGGILAPGNSIGTLRVNGNLTFAAGSTYRVEANALGVSDQIDVAGTATLNGNVVALPQDGGNYEANTRYTILTAASGLIGQFNSNVSSSLTFLDASLSHDTNNVYLNLQRNEIAYADVAQTRNQRNLATALQNASTVGGNSAAMDDVLTLVNNLSADKARAAFESMSGSGLVGLQRAGVNFTGNFANQLNGRLHSAGMGRTAQSINGVQLAANDRVGDLMPALAQNTMSDAPSSDKFSMGSGIPGDDGKRGFWLRGYGFDQDTDGDGNAASTRIKGVGITAGFDKRIRDNLVVGAAFTHGTSDVRASFAETGKSRGNAIAAYASYTNGPWNINGNLLLAHNANTMNRNVTVGTLTNTARANFDSKTVSAYGEASYDLPQATWTLQPLAGLSMTHNRNDGFTETGAGALNIQAHAQSMTSTKTLFGARALLEFNGIHVQPRAIWAHEFGDVNNGLTAQLQGSSAAAFTTYGVDLPRDSLITGVTVAGKTRDGLSLFADVQGEFNSKQTGLALLVGVRKSW